jgi:hypothetical protein
MGPAARLFLFAAGLVPLLAPYELIIRPDWTTFASPAFIFALVISAGAISVSVLMLGAAIAGIDDEVRFEPAGREVIHRSRSPVARMRERRYPFDSVASLETEAVQWDSRADTFRLRLVTRDGQTIRFGAFGRRDSAERVRADLLAILNPGDTAGVPDAGPVHGTESTRQE